MKAVSGKYIARLLKKRGWKLESVSGSHHKFIHPNIPRHISVPIHGNKTLATGMQRGLMKDAKHHRRRIITRPQNAWTSNFNTRHRLPTWRCYVDANWAIWYAVISTRRQFIFFMRFFVRATNPLLKLFSPITPTFLIAPLIPLYVAWFFFMIRFYLMPWLLGYHVLGMLSFPLESELAASVAKFVGFFFN